MTAAPPIVDLGKKAEDLATKFRNEAKDLERPPSGNMTNKREGQYNSNLTKAKKLTIQADILEGYAVAYTEQRLPDMLRPVGSLGRVSLEHLCLVKTWPHEQYNQGIANALKKVGFTPENYEALREELISLAAKTDTTGIEIRRREAALRPGAIPGYFPTPPAIIARMLDYADLYEGCTILEPSAGSGSIVDAIRAHWDDAVTINVCEWNHDLAELLRLKGYTFAERIGSDFMKGGPYDQDPRYDRIVMNPPFENHADIRHIRRAYDWLASEGALVAVVSETAMISMHTEAVQFRIWLQSLGAEVEGLPDDAFKPSGTSMKTRLVIIGK